MARKCFHNIELYSQVLDLIDSDNCEFNGLLSRNINHYFITFIANISRYIHVHLMENRSEAFNYFKCDITLLWKAKDKEIQSYSK